MKMRCYLRTGITTREIMKAKIGRVKLPRTVWRKPAKFVSDSLLRETPIEQIKQALDYAKTSLAIEGESIPHGTEELIMSRLKREISQQEFRRMALEIATR
jgi:hypothetical protein